MAIFKNTFLNSISMYLNDHKGFFLTQLGIISLGVLAGFIEWGIFYWLNENDFTKIATFKGILFLIFFFIFIVEFILVTFNLSAYIYWVCAKKWGGVGSFSDTCIAVLWTAILTFVPFGLFFMIIQFDKLIGTAIHGISCIGIVAIVIYGIVSMSGKLSKIHGVSSDQGVNIFLLGTLLQAPIQLLIVLGTITHLRTILILTLPISVQVITTFAIITIGFNILKKFSKARP